MANKNKEEYYFLTDRLDEITWALEGQCNDIDCDKYMYKDILKKKYKPVLEHNFSCVKKLKMEKEIIMRILSQNKYKRYRYIKCYVCHISLDKLNEKNKIVSFTRKMDKGYSQWNGFWIHNKCNKKVKIPKGWEKKY